jgi:hypothetical protein
MTNHSFIPDSYAAWRHCIEVICKQVISPAYVKERISELESPSHYKTQQFVKFYGDAHRRKVLKWFKHAGHELGMTGL